MRLHSPGFLIAIEGIDGAGKTTQAQFLQKTLEARRLKIVRTREPTNGKWGQLLRNSAQTGRLSLEEELDAFLRDRQEHVEQVIRPALVSGATVIMDRYYFSNAAYQGARGLDPARILSQNEEFAPEPDLLVLIDIAPGVGLERIRTRGDRADLFENSSALEKAQAIFQSIERPYLLRLDGRQGVQVIREAILAAFARGLAEKIKAAAPTDRDQLSETLALLRHST